MNVEFEKMLKILFNLPRVGDKPDHNDEIPSNLEILTIASKVPLKYLGRLNHLQSQIS